MTGTIFKGTTSGKRRASKALRLASPLVVARKSPRKLPQNLAASLLSGPTVSICGFERACFYAGQLFRSGRRRSRKPHLGAQTGSETWTRSPAEKPSLHLLGSAALRDQSPRLPGRRLRRSPVL
jgi:hypothetical protein